MATFSYSTRVGALSPMPSSHEELSATTGGVISLTATKYRVVTNPTAQSGVGGTQMQPTVLASLAMVQVTANAARYTLDGTTPTTGATGTGFDAAAGDFIVLDGFEAIRLFKIIGATATATVKVCYFRL